MSKALQILVPAAAARTLARLHPQLAFVYVSGDGTKHGRSIWARVKGRTANALLALPFKAVYLFRPGLIQPLHGARSKTAAYRLIYFLTKPPLPVQSLLFPKSVLMTEMATQAMLAMLAVA